MQLFADNFTVGFCLHPGNLQTCPCVHRCAVVLLSSLLYTGVTPGAEATPDNNLSRDAQSYLDHLVQAMEASTIPSVKQNRPAWQSVDFPKLPDSTLLLLRNLAFGERLSFLRMSSNSQLCAAPR